MTPAAYLQFHHIPFHPCINCLPHTRPSSSPSRHPLCPGLSMASASRFLSSHAFSRGVQSTGALHWGVGSRQGSETGTWFARTSTKAASFKRHPATSRMSSRYQSPRQGTLSLFNPQLRSPVATKKSSSQRPARAGIHFNSKYPSSVGPTLRGHPTQPQSMRGPPPSSAHPPLSDLSQEALPLIADDMEPLVILFDLETTGLSWKTDCILEMAARDLRGGSESAFETLVNPDWLHPDTFHSSLKAMKTHGINVKHVRKPSVPTMKQLAPFLEDFVEWRRLERAREWRENAAVSASGINSNHASPLGVMSASRSASTTGFGSAMSPSASASASASGVLPEVILVAHNGNNFDFKLLLQEYRRWKLGTLPAHWRLFDTLALARKLRTLVGLKQKRAKSRGLADDSASLSLGKLFERLRSQNPDVFHHIHVPEGNAHRAMHDVHMLSAVLHCMLLHLRMPLSSLLELSTPVAQFVEETDLNNP